jgi:hypothetical protein
MTVVSHDMTKMSQEEREETKRKLENGGGGELTFNYSDT